MPNLFSQAERAALSQQIYSPLAPGEIRLLYLHPGAPSIPLSARLLTVPISGTSSGISSEPGIKFEALSYTWGNPLFAYPIQLGGTPFSITANLSDALKQLRYASGGGDRVLWVDAICINQLDLGEKGVQVAGMSDIYSRAKVVVWLGAEGVGTRACFEFLDRESDGLDAIHMLYEDSDGEEQVLDARMGRDVLAPDVVAKRQERLSQEIGKLTAEERLAICKGAIDLLRRPWASRAWIVQEVYKPSEWTLTVSVGSAAISWRVFMCLVDCHGLILDAMKEFPDVIPLALSDLGPPADAVWKLEVPLRFLRDFLAEGPIPEAVQLMSDTVHVQATDKRDRVYALMGMGHIALEHMKHEGNFLPIDYTVSTETVFTRLALYLLNDSKSLDLLYRVRPRDIGGARMTQCGCRALHADLTRLNLPSWVPDWRCFSNGDVGRHYLWGLRDDSWEFQSGMRLKLQGLRVARIVETALHDANATDTTEDVVLAHCEYTPAFRNNFASSSCRVMKEERQRLPDTDLDTAGQDTDELSSVTCEVIVVTFAGLETVTDWRTWLAQPGDVLVTLVGTTSPFVLRPLPSGGYHFIEYAALVQWGLREDGERVENEVCSRLKELRQDPMSTSQREVFEVF